MRACIVAWLPRSSAKFSGECSFLAMNEAPPLHVKQKVRLYICLQDRTDLGVFCSWSCNAPGNPTKKNINMIHKMECSLYSVMKLPTYHQLSSNSSFFNSFTNRSFLNSFIIFPSTLNKKNTELLNYILQPHSRIEENPTTYYKNKNPFVVSKDER